MIDLETIIAFTFMAYIVDSNAYDEWHQIDAFIIVC